MLTYSRIATMSLIVVSWLLFIFGFTSTDNFVLLGGLITIIAVALCLFATQVESSSMGVSIIEFYIVALHYGATIAIAFYQRLPFGVTYTLISIFALISFSALAMFGGAVFNNASAVRINFWTPNYGDIWKRKPGK